MNIPERTGQSRSHEETARELRNAHAMVTSHLNYSERHPKIGATVMPDRTNTFAENAAPCIESSRITCHFTPGTATPARRQHAPSDW
jgi:hypothetical protein